MSKEYLSQQLGVVSALINERLSFLQTDAEKQQFTEGIFFILDALPRHCAVDLHKFVESVVDEDSSKLDDILTPFEQQELLGTIKANVYSQVCREDGLDSETHMKPLIESASQGVYEIFKNALFLQTFFGASVSNEEVMRLRNLVINCALNADNV